MALLSPAFTTAIKLLSMPNVSNQIEIERRSKMRFVFQHELRYKQLSGMFGRVTQSGTGKTLDISRRGVSFIAEQELKAGTAVKLSIHWPVRLNNVCQVRLVILGRIVRSEGSIAVSSIERYEFRTAGSQVPGALTSPKPDRPGLTKFLAMG